MCTHVIYKVEYSSAVCSIQYVFMCVCMGESVRVCPCALTSRESVQKCVYVYACIMSVCVCVCVCMGWATACL